MWRRLTPKHLRWTPAGVAGSWTTEALLSVEGPARPSASGGGGDRQPVQRLGDAQPVADLIQAAAAAGARSAGVADLLLRARPGGDGLGQFGLADGEADADVHGVTLPGVRPPAAEVRR